MEPTLKEKQEIEADAELLGRKQLRVEIKQQRKILREIKALAENSVC